MSPDLGAAERLSEHLDAVVTGTAVPTSQTDPVMTETAARFFAADDAPAPPPDLAGRIWANLLSAHQHRSGRESEAGSQKSEETPATAPFAHRDGRRAGDEEKRDRPPTSKPGIPTLVRSRWEKGVSSGDASDFRPPASDSHWGEGQRRLLAPLATAALVVLTLIASLVAVLGPLQVFRQGERTTSIPATSGVLEMTTVAEAYVTAWPAAEPLLWATLRRETFDPGAVEEFGVAGVTGDSLDLFIVESGQLTVAAEGPMYLWRESDNPGGEPSSLPSGSTVVLNPGDRLFVPPGAASLRRNDAGEPAVIVGFQMTQQEVLLYPRGVTNNRVEPDKILNTPPPAPATLGLSRLRLLPGEQVPLFALPGLQMLHVEEGTLELIGARRLGDLSPESWKAIPAGQGMAHFDTTTALANGTAEPVSVMIVTIETAS